MLTGNRKLLLGVLYLLICGVVAIAAVMRGVDGFDALGLAGLCASMATGLTAIVWGNVQEHKTKNGSTP